MALSISYVDAAGVTINWSTAVVNGVATTNIYSVTADDLHSNTFLWAPSGSPVSAAQVLAARADTVPAGGKARVGTLASATDIVNTGPGQSTRYLPTGATAGTVRGAQNNGEGVILVDALGTETIDGGTNSSLIQPGELVQFQSNGSGAWVRLSAANALLNSTYARLAPDWTTGRAYVVGELAVSSGTIYRCATAHTSSGSFDGSKFASVSGGVTEAVNTVAASGAAVTIPAVTTATINNVTLTANCTFTFPAATSGATFTLVLTQDGTGSRTATWPAGAQWPAGTAPSLSTGAGKRDVLTFTSYNGTAWVGSLDLQDVR